LPLLLLLLDCGAFLLSWSGLGRSLLLRRRWAGALNFLLLPTGFLRRSLLLDLLLPATLAGRLLPFPLSSHGRPLHVLLVVLPHDGVARLVAVALALERLLLIYCAGVPIS